MESKGLHLCVNGKYSVKKLNLSYTRLKLYTQQKYYFLQCTILVFRVPIFQCPSHSNLAHCDYPYLTCTNTFYEVNNSSANKKCSISMIVSFYRPTLKSSAFILCCFWKIRNPSHPEWSHRS